MSEGQPGRGSRRQSVLDMPAEDFRSLGHELVDRIADFYASIGDRRLTRDADPAAIRELLGDPSLPGEGRDPSELIAEIAPLLFDYSLHNGHPRFMGYITSSAAPLGALADFLAAAVNANMARWEISPLASEVESQAVQWVADFIGFERYSAGLMVSGGNMANFVAFVAARTAQAPWKIRDSGNYADSRRLTAYVSSETHTWIQKAADVCGLGADGIRWIDTDADGRMRVDLLREQLEADRANGRLPFLVVGTGGSVSQGVVDPLRELAAVCEEQGLWFHVDGAYGAPAAALPESPDDLRALALADSVAVDPHKWLYCPIEVGCVMTRHATALKDAFSFRPEYYRLAGRKASGTDFYELGMQNTRGFRALKVWLLFRAAGHKGYVESIREDIRLVGQLYERLDEHPEFSTHAVNLSIATFRYVPRDLAGNASSAVREYLDALNQALLAEVQVGGELFLSNAVINGDYLLRACIVNFRTTEDDVGAIPGLLAAIGQRLDRDLRPESLPG